MQNSITPKPHHSIKSPFWGDAQRAEGSPPLHLSAVALAKEDHSKTPTLHILSFPLSSPHGFDKKDF